MCVLYVSSFTYVAECFYTYHSYVLTTKLEVPGFYEMLHPTSTQTTSVNLGDLFQ